MRSPSARAAVLARVSLAAAVSLATAWSTDARAQSTSTSTITIGTEVGRRLPDAAVGSEYPYRNARRWWINWDECRANEIFDFKLTVTNPGDTLEVWAGTEDCAASRSDPSNHGQCWIVAQTPVAEFSIDIEVPVRNIVSNNVGADSANVADPDALGTEICDQSTDTDGVQLKLYFFLQDGGQVLGTPQTWDPSNNNLGGVGYDMIGPAPPESLTLGMGESQLSINLGEVQPDSDRERFAAYCAPVVADDMFVPADAGVEACGTGALIPNTRPDPALKCGEANETSNVITTDPSLPAGKLENGTTYAVAVSGQDIIENAGVLSPVVCGTPMELDDFFELYGGHGGPGGGGFCSLSPGRSSSVPGASALLGASLAALSLRRRRSRS